MEGTIKEKVLNRCTTAKFWVCMVEGRVLVSRRGNCAFTRKSSAVQAFLNSKYWIHEEDEERCRRGYSWEEWESCKALSKACYEKLKNDGKVRFLEVEPISNYPDQIC